MQLLERAEGRRQQVDPDRRACTHSQVSAFDAVHLFEGERSLVEHVEGAPRIRVENRARLGQLHFLADTIQERHSFCLLQLFYLVRDRGLAEAQRLRGEAESSEARYLFQRPQLTQCDGAVQVEAVWHRAYDICAMAA